MLPIQKSPEEELETLMDNIKASRKLTKPGGFEIIKSPKVVKIGDFKGVSWAFSSKGDETTLVTTRAIYIPANGYLYKFTMNGIESEWGKLFDKITETIKVTAIEQ